MARYEWVESRQQDLLPIPYFHAVFTIPSELNSFALRNKKAFYAILFRSVIETLQQCASPRFPGALIGFIAVLHTWGQNLVDHPHIHCIIPSGGLSRDGKRWLKGSKSYLFPFSAMRILFRAKVLDYFKQGLADGSIGLHGSLSEFENQLRMKDLLNRLYKKKWIIYAKSPFSGPENVVRYLGNYTHRIAISERRIIAADEQSVSFRYKDYADNEQVKIMTLDTVEFTRRFLLHVLPKGFMRIRHYGFLSNALRKKSMAHCSQIFKEFSEKQKERSVVKTNLPWHRRMELKTGVNPLLCKKCRVAVMVLRDIIPPVPSLPRFVCRT